MPAAVITPRSTAPVDQWGPAVEEGISQGVQQGAAIVRDAATEALATRTDPWGAPFAPLSPVTVRLYATMGERDYASLGSSLALRRTDRTRVAVRVTGRPRAYAFRQQFGDEAAQMFNNAAPVRIPARPPLPMRSPGAVDVPPEMSAAILDAIRAGVRAAIQRDVRRRR